jgi:hypothetical protein
MKPDLSPTMFDAPTRAPISMSSCQVYCGTHVTLRWVSLDSWIALSTGRAVHVPREPPNNTLLVKLVPTRQLPPPFTLMCVWNIRVKWNTFVSVCVCVCVCVSFTLRTCMHTYINLVKRCQDEIIFFLIIRERGRFSNRAQGVKADAAFSLGHATPLTHPTQTSAYVSIRQHTSAYVSIQLCPCHSSPTSYTDIYILWNEDTYIVAWGRSTCMYVEE